MCQINLIPSFLACLWSCSPNQRKTNPKDCISSPPPWTVHQCVIIASVFFRRQFTHTIKKNTHTQHIYYAHELSALCSIGPHTRTHTHALTHTRSHTLAYKLTHNLRSFCGSMAAFSGAPRAAGRCQCSWCMCACWHVGVCVCIFSACAREWEYVVDGDILTQTHTQPHTHTLTHTWLVFTRCVGWCDISQREGTKITHQVVEGLHPDQSWLLLLSVHFTICIH